MKFEIRAYARSAHVALVALQAVAVLNVLYLIMHLVADVRNGTQTAPPRAVALGLAVFSGLPWCAVAVLRRVLRATLETNETHIILSLRRSRLEIPLASIKAIRPLVIPLPGPGLVLDMISGRLFRYRLEMNEPGALLAELGHHFAPAREVRNSRALAYADAKWKFTWRSRYVAWLKWGVLPLAIGVILFRLDQYIVYGGAFGQYRLQGLGPYLDSFVTYWGATTSYLVLYASVLRLCIEPLVLVVTAIAPARAGLVRRITEIVCQLAYFVLVPALVAYRLLL